MILLDANVLLRAFSRTLDEDGRYSEAVARAAEDQEELVCLTAQIRETYAVLARRGTNGVGRSPEQAAHEIDRLLTIIRVLPDDPSWLARWRSLVVAASVTGVRAHDAYLAAAALSLNCPLLSADEDFLRFQGLDLRLVPVSQIRESKRTVLLGGRRD